MPDPRNPKKCIDECFSATILLIVTQLEDFDSSFSSFPHLLQTPSSEVDKHKLDTKARAHSSFAHSSWRSGFGSELSLNSNIEGCGKFHWMLSGSEPGGPEEMLFACYVANTKLISLKINHSIVWVLSAKRCRLFRRTRLATVTVHFMFGSFFHFKQSELYFSFSLRSSSSSTWLGSAQGNSRNAVLLHSNRLLAQSAISLSMHRSGQSVLQILHVRLLDGDEIGIT